MKVRYSFLLTLTLFFGALTSLSSQIDSVKYQLQYNGDLCRYEAYLHIHQGASSNVFSRIQSSAQFTVVVDAGLSMSNINSYSPTPLSGGGTPNPWNPQNILIASDYNMNPTIPGNTIDDDFYGFVPADSPTAVHPEVVQGDSILIFSFELSPSTKCGQDARMWMNWVEGEPGGDPSASYLGGPNFNNAFTIGGPTQKYAGNKEQVFPDGPDLQAVTMCALGLEIDLTATSSACQDPLTYEWTGPAGYMSTDEDVAIDPANGTNNGTYKVVVTSAIGCKDSLEIDAIAKPSAGEDFSACAGATATLTGTSPTTGTWSADTNNSATIPVTNNGGGQADIDLAGISAGNYQFIYTVVSCADTVQVAVNQQDAGQAPPNISCNETGTATLAAAGTGTWSVSPASSGTATIGDPSNPNTTVSDFSIGGTYTLVWELDGCEDEVTFTVGEECGCPIAGNTLSPVSPNTYCGTSGAVTLDGSTATPAGTYAWQTSTDGGAFSSSTGTNNSEDYTTSSLGVGSYSFRRIYSITGGLSCSDTSNVVSFVVNDEPGTPANLTADPNPVCIGNTVTLTVTDIPGATFSWSAPASAGLGSSTSNTVTMNAVTIGTYTVSVTATTNGCESPEATIDVEVNPVPNTIDLADLTGADPSGCGVGDGSIAIVNLAPGENYTLDYTYNTQSQSASISADGSGNATLSDLSAGTYSDFVLTNSSGCSSGIQTGDAVLSDPSTPEPPTGITASPNPECAGEPVTLTVDDVDGATYSWTASSPDAGLVSSSDSSTTMTALTAGQYTVSVTLTTDGCTSNPISIGVLINDTPPTPSAGDFTTSDPTVCGGTDGSISISNLDPQTTYTINYNDNGTPQSSNGPTDQNGVYTISDLGEGTYTSFQISNFAGCQSGVFAGPVSLSDPGSPDAPSGLTAVPQTICLGESAELSADPNAGAVFNWSASAAEAGLGTSTSESNNMTPTAVGVYTISVSQTVAGCTSPSSSVEVTVLSTPAPLTAGDVTGTDPTVCSGIDGFINIDNLEPSTTYTVNYDENGNGVNASLTTDGAGSLTISGLGAGTYSNFIVTNAGNCNSEPYAGPISLVGPDAPEPPSDLVAMPNPACVGDIVTISLTEDPNATYTWSVSPTSTSSIVGTGSEVTFQIPSSGNFTISVTQTVAGCTSAAANVNIFGTVSPDPLDSDDFSVMNPSGCQQIDGSISISGLTPNVFYQFNYDSLEVSTSVQINTDDMGVGTIENLGSGSYANFYITNGSGCSSPTFAGPISLVDPGAPDAPANLIANPNPVCLGESIALSVDELQDAEYTWAVSGMNGNLGISTSNTNTFDPTVSGTYTVSVYLTLSGCTSATSAIDVVVNNIPPTPDDQTVTSTDVTACGLTDGSISISGLTSMAIYTVNYQFNATLISVSATANGSGVITLSDLGEGTYSDFQLVNTAGCSSGIFAGPINISVPNAPDAPLNLTADNTTACVGDDIVFTVDNNPNATYTWTASGAGLGLQSSTTNTTTANTQMSGTYTVSVTQTVAGCSSPAVTIDVTIIAPPSDITPGSITSANPSGCGVADGTITISGYNASEVYDLSYSTNMETVDLTITANGSGSLVITDLTAGSYIDFIITNSNGCSTAPYGGPITLADPGSPDAPSGLVASPNVICLDGSTIQLSAQGEVGASFNWSVSNMSAGLSNSTDNTNSITPTEAGTFIVMVSQSVAGCTSLAANVSILVRDDCLNPDFGVTYGNVPLTGQLSTNDMEVSGSTYNNEIVASINNPSVVLPTINSLGEYTFSTATVGEYEYMVDVCKPNNTSDCIQMPLVITVLDSSSMENPPVINHDYIATSAGQSVSIPVLENDKCQSSIFCTLDDPILVIAPVGGTFDPNSLIYTPNAGFVGQDSFRISIEQDPSTPQSIDMEWVYINVLPAFGTSYTNGMDDYNQTSANVTLSVSSNDGVLANDIDVFNDVQTVTPFVTTVSGAGTLDLAADGSYLFTPAMDYVGPVDFSYQVCKFDNNTLCDSATLHILVSPELGAGTINSLVWLDADGNGLYNSQTEIGIPDVVVNLMDESFNTVATTITNISGEYQFPGIPAGNYFVEVVSPPGLTLTIPNVGNDEENDSDITGVFGPGTSDLFELLVGQDLTSIKAGYYQCVKMGERVWFDQDEDDIFDHNENGLNGLVVELWRNVDGVFELWATTITGHKPGTLSDDGWYQFCEAPGTYFIKVLLPPNGLVQARPFIGNNPLIDSDLNNANGVGTTGTFTVSIGVDKLDIGAGFYPQAVAGNLVWNDENLDGIQNSFEERVEGVLVQAYEVGTNEMLGQSTTDENGVYMIDYLEKKDIYLKFYPPEGTVATVDHAGWDNQLDSDVDNTYGENTTGMFSMTPGDVKNQIDFGIAFGALPVEWVSVDVKAENNSHKVMWEVADQQNIDYYLVQRLLDGDQLFTDLTETRVNVRDALEAKYTAVDNDMSFDGKYYYRVKQVDIDGSYSFSKIVTVEGSAKITTSIYPNPATDRLSFKTVGVEGDEITVTIFNEIGKNVLSKVYRMNNDGVITNQVDLEGFTNGVYTIVIANSLVTFTTKFIKVE